MSDTRPFIPRVYQAADGTTAIEDPGNPDMFVLHHVGEQVDAWLPAPPVESTFMVPLELLQRGSVPFHQLIRPDIMAPKWSGKLT